MLQLSLSHFGVSYRGVPAIIDLSLTLTSATFAAVSGVLGAGKSSLLRAIAGSVQHSGDISVTDGSTLKPADVIARELPRSVVVPGMSLEQYLQLGILERSWVLPPDADTRIRSALHRCSLQNRLHDQVCMLSHAERRLADTALLLVQSPRIILMDEPSYTTTEPCERAVMEVLADWVKETRGIALFATADSANQPEFNRILPLAYGRLQAA